MLFYVLVPLKIISLQENNNKNRKIDNAVLIGSGLTVPPKTTTKLNKIMKCFARHWKPGNKK